MSTTEMSTTEMGTDEDLTFTAVFNNVALASPENCFLKREGKGKMMCLRSCPEGEERRVLFFALPSLSLSPDDSVKLIVRMIQTLQGELRLQTKGVDDKLPGKFLREYPISKFGSFGISQVFQAERGLIKIFESMLNNGRQDGFGYAYPQAIQSNLTSCARRPSLRVKLALRPLGMEFTLLLSIATFVVETPSEISAEQLNTWVDYEDSRYDLGARKVLFAFLCLFLLGKKNGTCLNRATILKFVEGSGLMAD